MSLNRPLPSLLVLLPLLSLCLADHPALGDLMPQDDETPTVATPTGLQVRLSEGAAVPDANNRTPATATTPLVLAQITELLARMAPMPASPDDAKDFAMRDRTKPPPRTGATVQGTFPPPQLAAPKPVVDTSPLQVLRYQPQGDVQIVPELTVTFSQPMVAVTSLEVLAGQTVPLKLTPQPAGRWRWLGTRTLAFTPDKRLPMATDFKAEIPAGTKSATGAVLAKAVTWQFRTPPPQVVDYAPDAGPTGLQPTLQVQFDQAVDPKAVLARTEIRAGKSLRAVAVLTPEEIAKDKGLTARRNALQAQGLADRWFAFRLLEPLPRDTTVSVQFGPKLPSAEGPRVTAQGDTRTFRTYGPLKLLKSQCGWDEQCRPFMPWTLEFSNPLDGKKFDAKWVTVTPTFPGLSIEASGDQITISGYSKGRTTYQVSVAAELADTFGQTLGKPVKATFKTGQAEPTLDSEGQGFVVLDPAASPSLRVNSVNQPELRVQLYAVTPGDWTAWLQWLKAQDDEDKPKATLPGKRILDQVIRPQGPPDDLAETDIDLSKALTNGLGHVIAVIEPTKQPKERWQRQAVRVWAQSTRIGLTSMKDDGELLAWSTTLQDGKPLGGLEVSIQTGKGKVLVAGKSGADGVTRLELPAQADGRAVLVARQGGDTAMLPESLSWWYDNSGWTRTERSPQLTWFTFDDRQLYKPGEEIHLKGWLRRLSLAKGGDVQGLAGRKGTVEWTLRDSQGNDLATGKANVGPLGGFDLSVKLPKEPNLGTAVFVMQADGLRGPNDGDHYHQVQIQEFRTPEYSVTAQASQGPHLVGGHAIATVSGRYFAGGPLPSAQTTWQVRTEAGEFTPPGREGWTFGTWRPWWERYWGRGDTRYLPSFGSRTDAAGDHNLRLDFLSLDPPAPTAVIAEATVMDVNRQAWTATARMLVHASTHYVGLKVPTTFVGKGDPIVVQVIAVDLDGKAVTGRAVQVRAARIEETYKDGRYVESEVDVQDCPLTSTANEQTCTFRPPVGGRWRVKASLTDAQGRPNRSELTVWVAGGKVAASRSVDEQKVTLVPDRKEHQAGQVAKVLVLSPFAPAEGVLTLRRSGIVEARRFTMATTTTTLEIPILDAYVPNIEAHVSLVGQVPRDADKPDGLQRPAFATGSVELSVPPLARALTVRVLPAATELEPGAKTRVMVEVRDARGQPVPGAEVALVAVDEAVLALTGYEIANPLALFHPKRGVGVQDQHARTYVLLGRPAAVLQGHAEGAGMGMVGVGRGGGGAGGGERKMMMKSAAPMPPPSPSAAAAKESDDASTGSNGGSAIAVRSDFNPLAVFAAALPTDAQGRAAVDVKVPDNLTRYRLTAVAVAGEKQFGKGDATLTARLPLMVRPSAPRFLNFGDRFELPVVIQNQTAQAMEVRLAVRASLLDLGTPHGGLSTAGVRVRVPANDRVEVRLPGTAPQVGQAHLQLAASSGQYADAAELSLPVWTPATTEAFATYGSIEQGAAVQPIAVPAGVVTQFGGLEVTTSSTRLQALTDAVLYLAAYPFECAEQLSSRILAVAALKDVLQAFHATGLPTQRELEAAVTRDLARLQTMQNDDGGFGFWRRGERDWPYLSIHVAHALVRAKAKGFAVDAEMLDRSKGYLRTIQQHIPKDYGLEVRRTLRAYALYVRQWMGDQDVPAAKALLVEAKGPQGLPLEAVGWLLHVVGKEKAATAEKAAILQFLNNRVTETAGAANFTTSYADGGYLLLASDRRTDGVILEALIHADPQNDLIGKVVEGLLAHRTRGHWGNTQDNAFVLLAMDRYFAVFEKTTPDFVARMWLGDAYAGEHPFKGRTTERFEVQVPMAFLAAQGDKANALTLQKDGAGRLYYRIGMRYAPADLKLPALDNGFSVERIYEAIDDPADVQRLADGTWQVKAGAKVRVRVTMVAKTRRYHVALVDPLPAGFEALNPALATTGELPPDVKDPSQNRTWWWGPWFDHQNLRDERAEAFTSLLWEGVYDYTYVCRATTPGRFVAPPPKAEEMYSPEVFGRGAGDVVVVK